jgi:hypothetical protein
MAKRVLKASEGSASNSTPESVLSFGAVSAINAPSFVCSGWGHTWLGICSNSDGKLEQAAKNTKTPIISHRQEPFNIPRLLLRVSSANFIIMNCSYALFFVGAC